MSSRRALGSTNLMVTRFGLGLAALGRPGYITLGHAGDLQNDIRVERMQAHTHAMLDHAWQLGVRYYDAARSYGRAEEFLGSWLAAASFAADDRPVIGSKWGYAYTANWQVDASQHEVKEHSVEMLQRQWQESQRTLGGKPHLYQIHSATFESGVLSDSAVLAALAAIKSEGVAIGLSLSGANQSDVLAVALDVIIDGQRLFDAVQATWNLLEPSCGPLLQRAASEGVGVIVKEALANGRLTGRNQAADFAPKLAQLAAVARQHNTSIDAVALAAALSQPWATVVLSGAATTSQLDSNLSALTVALTPEDWHELGELVESPQAYWSTRSRLAWN